MPLPLFLGIGAAIAAAGGIGSGIHGAVKMNDAKNTLKYAEERHNKNMQRFKTANTKTTKCMDALGRKEMEILSTFEKFSELFEKIQNKPVFEDITINGNVLPKYDGEELKKVSVGACALLSGLGGAALGTAGGFAAAGATTAAVMTLGTASTGTAIASLSGVAATNATLAALGGGSIAAGGGGIALGTTMLGVTTAGVGLLVGGIIFSITGSSISNKADKAYAQMKKAESQINEICSYLNALKKTATKYNETLCYVNNLYQNHLIHLEELVNEQNKTDWLTYSDDEKLIVTNTILLVGLLYKMCKVQLVLKKQNDINEINYTEINKIHETADAIIADFSDIDSDLLSKEEENKCIATIAVISFFAKSDGEISSEENDILLGAINDITNHENISDSAKQEISEILAYDTMTFDQLKIYLDRLTVEEVLEFDDLIENVIMASDGITEQEAKAKEKFKAYIVDKEHENSQEECSPVGAGIPVKTQVFKMEIENVLTLFGRGTVFTGRIDIGHISIGDSVTVEKKNGQTIDTKITQLEMFAKSTNTAKQGDNVALNLDSVDKNDVTEGDIIVKYETVYNKSTKNSANKSNAKDTDHIESDSPQTTNFSASNLYNVATYGAAKAFGGPVGIAAVAASQKLLNKIKEEES